MEFARGYGAWCICRLGKATVFCSLDFNTHCECAIRADVMASDKFCKSRKSAFETIVNDMISQEVLNRVVYRQLRVLACLIAAIGLYGLLPMASRAERMSLDSHGSGAQRPDIRRLVCAKRWA